MGVIKAFAIAFSMYSQIPMPQFPWEEEEQKYVLCFFPWVGAVIGVCVYLWGMLCRHLEIGILCYTLVGTAIPLLITGGFHVDGFMDTMDAFHSYQKKEKKLEILKDSHIGAFAVIMLGVYGLLYVGAFSEVQDKNLLQTVCAGFFLARCLSGISVVSHPLAKKEGLLYSFANSAQKKVVKISLYVQAAVCAAFMLIRAQLAGGAVILAAIGVFIYYDKRCKKELGGSTGDTAGYFLLLCEGGMVVVAAVLSILK